ncbi:MAG: MBL fold metallo-hydrolase [Oscillospiraceae bacterium]
MRIQRIDCGYMAANCYALMYEDNKLALIDPGDGANIILDFMRRNNLTLTDILLTHGHYDHIGAVQELTEKTGCKVSIGKGNEIMLSSSVECAADFLDIPNPEKYLCSADILLSDGDRFNLGQTEVKVISVPGHSRADICYVIEDVMFTGDVLFADSCGRADLPGGDWRLLEKSLRRLSLIDGDYKILSGHGAGTTLARERKYNPYLR